MCQERSEDLGFIDEVGDFDESNRSFKTDSTGVPASTGRCTLVRPAIGSILPVYVYDEYKHFTAKTFVELTEEELAGYTERNVTALKSALEAFEPDVVVTGHEVMGPYIAASAEIDVGYSAKLHGSALEYAVKKQERYLRFAETGLSNATVVIGGSKYMVEAAAAVIPGWRDKAVVINPGCDVDIFRPRQRSGQTIPLVGYIGKLIAQKGVHRLLAAIAAIDTRPLKVVIVGYGGDEDDLRALAEALLKGDVERAQMIARDLNDDEVVRFLDELGPRAKVAHLDVEIEFTGRLEHGPLAELLPTFDVLAVPSILPEAFGMVAAEGAACGVLPVVPDHSGIGEAGAAVESAIGRPGFLTYDSVDPVPGLGAAIERVLALPAEERADLGAKAVGLARSRWSWDEVARSLLEASTPR
jgi:glycosyltransferase involved in cell wall biosynthesis